MRTTLTLDDDVAAKLSLVREEKNLSLKFLVNEVLRIGLEAYLDESQKTAIPYRLKTVKLAARVPSVDDVADVLSTFEGESFK